MRCKFILLIPLLLLLFPSCRSRREDKVATAETITAPRVVSGCRGCHPLDIDPNHDLGCSTCHHGRDNLSNIEASHQGLIPHPAQPKLMARTCGPCHHQVPTAAKSIHFTLKKAVNLVRRHFGAQKDLDDLTRIPLPDPPRNILGLADDLLRRRCLRCHLYFEGDAYPATRRATGCGACHLEYHDGKMISHRFILQPDDDRCLSCHYGNHVGADYYGMFEHDYKWEFRTPYQADGTYAKRPFGVEQHRLIPDIHKTAGLICIDCHSGRELMGPGHGMPSATHKRLSCRTCHQWRPGSAPPLANLNSSNNRLYIKLKGSGKTLLIPQMRNPAHEQYGSRADCTVCHAQWSFNDWGTNLIRIDAGDLDDWTEFVVQSSFESEWQLNQILHNGNEDPPMMADKITGVLRPGIWLKGFEKRRWQPIPIGTDKSGRLRIMRPILDLRLSYVNADEEVIFNSEVTGAGKIWLPYTPHTIGPTPVFFRRRLKDNLREFGNAGN